MDRKKSYISIGILFLSAICIYFGYQGFVNGDSLSKGRFYALIGVCIICFLIYKIVFYMKDLHTLNSSLVYENNPDRFIEECDKMIESSKVMTMKNIWLVNKSAGYTYKADFKNVIDTLKQIDITKLGSFKLVYYNNLAYAYLMLDKDNEGFQIIERNKKGLLKAIKRKQNAKDFCLTFALYFLKKKDYKKSLEFIKLSKNYTGLMYTADSFEVLKAWIFAETGQKELAEKMLFKMINDSQFTGIKALAQNVFNKCLY